MSSTLWRCFWIQSHCFPWLRWTGPFLCGSRLPKHSILLSTWNWGAQSTRWSRGQGNNESEKKKKPNKTKFRGRKFPLIDQSKTDSEVERGRVLDIQLLNDCMKTKAGTDSSFLAPSPPLPSPPSLTFFKEGDLIWRIRLKWTINSSKIGRWSVKGQRKLFAKCVHIQNHHFAKTSSISVGLLNIWWCAFENWESP